MLATQFWGQVVFVSTRWVKEPFYSLHRKYPLRWPLPLGRCGAMPHFFSEQDELSLEESGDLA